MRAMLTLALCLASANAFALSGSVTAPWLPLTGQLVESATLPASDMATGGWPAQLLASLQAAGMRPTCTAPIGASEAEKNQCVPSLTYRIGQNALYVSPDAGQQWYPISTSCSLTLDRSAHLLAVDSGRPGHLVTWHDRGTDGSGATGAPEAIARSIAWTADVSLQVKEAMVRASDAELPTSSAMRVDAAGFPGSDDPVSHPDGWRYAALGHLSGNQPAKVCDVAHAGIQVGCTASPVSYKWCHGNQSSVGASHERFVADQGNSACTGRFNGADGNIVAADLDACRAPHLTALAIDPRNGQTYASSDLGLLFSPDGGRTWRRHGHSAYTRWSLDGQHQPSADFGAATNEPMPYAYAPPVPDAINDPGIRLLTTQGLPLMLQNHPLLAFLGLLDLNAQFENLRFLGQVAFATTPCAAAVPGEALKFKDALQYDRERVRVTATLIADWQNPLQPTERFSSVFIAQGDSCSDAAGRAPLVFHDTANTTPITYRAAGSNTVNREPWPI